jgi:hypothetical protein
MIANPDYAEKNPKEPNTVELYKVVNDHLILPIKLNEKKRSQFFWIRNGTP